MNHPKRSYIRRKKIYNQSKTLVIQTLQLISLVNNEKIPTTTIEDEAKRHADLIEAVCWDPRARIADDLYKQIVIQKTKQLCASLIGNSAPKINAITQYMQKNGYITAQELFPKIPNQNQKIPIPSQLHESTQEKSASNSLAQDSLIDSSKTELISSPVSAFPIIDDIRDYTFDCSFIELDQTKQSSNLDCQYNFEF